MFTIPTVRFRVRGRLAAPGNFDILRPEVADVRAAMAADEEFRGAPATAAVLIEATCPPEAVWRMMQALDGMARIIREAGAPVFVRTTESDSCSVTASVTYSPFVVSGWTFQTSVQEYANRMAAAVAANDMAFMEAE